MSEQKLKHVCKFCKKSFACGRSLGRHVRSHLPKPAYELRENRKKTWRVSNNSVGDVRTLNSAHSSQFESEFEPRYSKLSKVNQNQANKPGFVGNTCNSSVSEVVEEEQQEEVAIAMCLIMLSRDVGPWGDASSAQGKNSKRKKGEQIHGKGSIFTAVNGEKLMNLDDGHLQKGMKLKGIEVSVSNDQSNELSEGKRWKDKIEGKESIACVSDHGIPIKNEAKMKKFDGFVSNDQENLSSVCKRRINYTKFQSAASKHVKNRCKMEEFCSDFQDNSYIDHDLVFDEYGEMCINSSFSKRSKFECTTCKKVFHSYQALGGHRASHKKLNAVKDSPVVPKTDEQETVGNGESPVSQPDYEKQPRSEEVVTVIGVGQSSLSSKKLVQKHECPICFRVFSSGPALGGHKRSHMLASNSESNATTTETKINQSFSRNAEAIERSSSSETRDMLDLNFPPASAQKESTTTLTTASSSNSLVGLIKPYWWFESSHKHELLSLISN